MSLIGDSEMNVPLPNWTNVETYRKLVQTYLNLHSNESALFWADKVVALTDANPSDVYWQAQCMYALGQYHRAAHLLRLKNLDKKYILCNNLTVRCLLAASELNEALKVINSIDLDVLLQNESVTAAGLEFGTFDDTPRNQIQSAVLLLKGKVLEAMDNRGLASDCYKQALLCDIHCYEAFECLIKHNMLTSEEEEDLLHSLQRPDQSSDEEGSTLLLLYRSKLKKYHTPTELSGTGKIHNPPMALIISEEGDSTTSISESAMITPKVPGEQELASKISEPTLSRLSDSLDFAVARAEQLYYNCDYQHCLQLSENILKQDPYHSDCLPVHISCLVELKNSNKLFSLAHKLVDLYPNLALSWFAVGCYYYIIGKSDCARKYLAKAASLDKLFGPAWLAFGHSFAVENEHDQAMAAYFKASQLMRGCHLPLLYIGLECGLTNNIRLAEKFFHQANKIAPDDPFVLHEMGVIAFQNFDYAFAEQYFRNALRILKTHKSTITSEVWAPLYNNLGHVLRKQSKYRQSLIQHHEALVLAPQNASTYSAIAYVHALMNNPEEAADWFHKALGLKRDDTFSTTMLNYVLEQLAEEQPPYPGAPDYIPDFVKSEEDSLPEATPENSNVQPEQNSAPDSSDMEMSLQMDETDMNLHEKS